LARLGLAIIAWVKPCGKMEHDNKKYLDFKLKVIKKLPFCWLTLIFAACYMHDIV
jgi:hypothetical protein